MYRYISKEQATALPDTPQKFMQTALNIEAKANDTFNMKQGMKDFLNVITNKSEHAKVSKEQLILGQKLGGGIESEVFKSSWLGTDVAVKYFRYPENLKNFSSVKSATSYDSKDNLKSFCNEVAMLMGLRHKNIIMLMGFGVVLPSQFIVMEYMPKGSLFDVLASKDFIDAELKHKFITDIVDGLAYLHTGSPPILHQDLKSLNLLVDSDYTIKISDFGIAKELKTKKLLENVNEMNETNENESISHGGTLQWLAPECIVDEIPPTKEADIYALG
jgi:serine/threonine protein kinase